MDYDNLQVFDRESLDYEKKMRSFKKGTVQEDRSESELRAEAETVQKMLVEYEHVKMDVEAGSKWFVLSLDWFNKWKSHVGFDGGEPGPYPGPIMQDDIVDDEDRAIVID